MSETDFKILGLAASLRRASIHRGLLRAAHEVCPQGMACESFDLGRIPHFNADVEAEGDPEPVRELKEKIRAYDAVLIASPEYDYAVPGVFTTALDGRANQGRFTKVFKQDEYQDILIRSVPKPVIGEKRAREIWYWCRQ